MASSTSARRQRQAGVAGLIVPDLPPEEAEPLQIRRRAAWHRADLPRHADQPRAAHRAGGARGRGHAAAFIYCVSLSGVTGARDRLPDIWRRSSPACAAKTSLPLAVGFGVSRPEHVAEIGRIADGAVVASALLNAVDAAPADASERRRRACSAGASGFFPFISRAGARHDRPFSSRRRRGDSVITVSTTDEMSRKRIAR